MRQGRGSRGGRHDERLSRRGPLRLAVVGAQHAVPGKHTWLLARHPPLIVGAVIPSGVSRALGFARSAGTRSRGISLRLLMRPAWTANPRCFFVGPRHAVPGKHAWLPAGHRPLAMNSRSTGFASRTHVQDPFSPSDRNTSRVEHDATHRKQRTATVSTRHNRETPACGNLPNLSNLTALHASPKIGGCRTASDALDAAGATP